MIVRTASITSAVALVSTLLSSTIAFVPEVPLRSFGGVVPAVATTTARKMAIDYNDPVVAEEFAKVQTMDFDDVEEELQAQGIRVAATVTDMDAKLMLVEMRMVATGQIGGKGKKKRPTKFSSSFEEAMWTKPAFEELVTDLEDKGDHNARNVVSEYLIDKKLALERYGKTYKGLLRKAEAALNAPPPVNSPILKFSGFPANMGEEACKMTLEAVGAVSEFSCALDEDFPTLSGQVTYEDIEDAKKAVAQYNGMDMGMGSAIEMMSV